MGWLKGWDFQPEAQEYINAYFERYPGVEIISGNHPVAKNKQLRDNTAQS